MNQVIIISTIIIGALGLGVSVWSLIATRKKYFDEYLARKGERND